MDPASVAAAFAVGLVLAIVLYIAVASYNAVMALRQRIDKAWANIDVVLKQRHDQLPNLYSFLAFCHHERLSLREHEKLQVAMYEDVSWDGEPIAGMTASQAAALQRLHG